MQTEEKKQSIDEAAWAWLKRTFVRISKPLVCVIAALMSVGVLVIMQTQGVLQRLFALDVLNMVSQCVLPFTALALAVIAVIHIFKAVPRLLLLSAGFSAFLSLQLLASGWTPALLMLGAGLLLFVLEIYRQNRLLHDVPRQKVKGVLLIIAGALALVWAAYQIYATYTAITSQTGYSEGNTVAFFTGLANLVGCICIALACFMKNRPISVYYRMFFTGSAAIYILQSVLGCVALLKYTGVPVQTYAAYIGNAAAVLAITALIVIHTIKSLPKKAATVVEETPEETAEEASEEAAETDAE